MKRLVALCLAVVGLALTSGCTGQSADNKFTPSEKNLVYKLGYQVSPDLKYAAQSTQTQMNGAEYDSLNVEGTLPADGRTVAQVTWDTYSQLLAIPGVVFPKDDGNGHPDEALPAAGCRPSLGADEEVNYPDTVPPTWMNCALKLNATSGDAAIGYVLRFQAQPDGSVNVSGSAVPVGQ